MVSQIVEFGEIPNGGANLVALAGNYEWYAKCREGKLKEYLQILG